MRINEILDSTSEWAVCADVDLRVYDDLLTAANQHKFMIENLQQYLVGRDKQLQIDMITSAIKTINDYFDNINEYLSDVSRLGIDYDEDLNSRISHLHSLKDDILNKLQSITS